LREGKLYVEQVRTSDRTHLVSVLMHGPPGSGKSALAASIAMASDFAFVKLISPEAMVGYSELSRIQYISKVFNDSYKSPNSLIVVDNIERLLGIFPPLNQRPFLIQRLDCAGRTVLECDSSNTSRAVPETSTQGASSAYHRDNIGKISSTTNGCHQCI
jgi:hypothetical protein